MKKLDTNFSESEDDLCWPYVQHIFLIIFLCLLLSCAPKNSNKLLQKKEQQSKSIHASSDSAIKIAKHYDIPSPVGYKFIEEPKPGRRLIDAQKESLQNYLDSDFVSYVGDLPKDQVLSFYRGNMEQHGWKIVDLSNEQEGLLFCKKPSKYCIVSIRDIQKDKSNEKKNYVCLFIKNKLKGEEKQKKDINSRVISLENLFS